MIQLSELTKTFGDRTLFDHVTWQITDRERVGLCGPNGAGKTTLLKMMAGLDEPDSGAILMPSATTVGYLPQDGLSHAGRTVFDEPGEARPCVVDGWGGEFLGRVGRDDSSEPPVAPLADNHQAGERAPGTQSCRSWHRGHRCSPGSLSQQLNTSSTVASVRCLPQRSGGPYPLTIRDHRSPVVTGSTWWVVQHGSA